jgi:hypothetical protein
METHVLTQPTHELRLDRNSHAWVGVHLWLLLFLTIPYYTWQSTTGVNCLVPKSYHIFKLMFFSFFRKLKIKINGRKEIVICPMGPKSLTGQQMPSNAFECVVCTHKSISRAFFSFFFFFLFNF